MFTSETCSILVVVARAEKIDDPTRKSRVTLLQRPRYQMSRSGFAYVSPSIL